MTLKKVLRFLVDNWLWIIAGLILTKLAVKYAYQERGYMAYGGEWLVLPVILMAKTLVRDIVLMFIEVFAEEAAERDRKHEARRRSVKKAKCEYYR